MSSTDPSSAVGDDAEVLRVGHVLREHHRAAVPARDRVALRVLEDVVAEDDDEPVVAGELLAIPTTCAIPPGSICTL